MSHILDNPAWHGLNSGNRSLAHGQNSIKYFWQDVSPFVGLEMPSTALFDALYRFIPFDDYHAVISVTEIPIPPQWEVLECVSVWQMVCVKTQPIAAPRIPVKSLRCTDVPEMLALTKLTRPGPFEQNTINFGHYEGIYEQERLVAMAGQRLNPTPYAEISAVCTHPDHLGKGLATQLLLRQINRIQSSGEIPFLHVKAENSRAINVYAKLGFEKRRELLIYILKKHPSV